MLQTANYVRQVKPTFRVSIALDFKDFPRADVFGNAIKSRGHVMISAPTFSNPSTGKVLVRDEEWRMGQVHFTEGKTEPLHPMEFDYFYSFIQREHAETIRTQLIQEAANSAKRK